MTLVLSHVPGFADDSVRPAYQWKLVAQHTHQEDAYCQGLVYQKDPASGQDVLYESVGRYGRSELRLVNPISGKVLRSTKLADRFFAEGIALVNDRIFQLTWQERTCLVYDRATFELKDEFRYPREGWGLAWDGNSLWLSDGSATLRGMDPATFREQKRINVFYKRDGKNLPVRELNELEWVEGEIWANVYQTSYIVRIDPQTGEAFDIIDCSSLVPANLIGNSDLVMNGIAYDSVNKRLFLTGKCWPVLYEFKLTPKR